jgi:hypothetical protein
MTATLAADQLATVRDMVSNEWRFATARLTQSEHGTGTILTVDASWATRFHLTVLDLEPVIEVIPLIDGQAQPYPIRHVESLGLGLTSSPLAITTAVLERLRLRAAADGYLEGPERGEPEMVEEQPG